MSRNAIIASIDLPSEENCMISAIYKKLKELFDFDSRKTPAKKVSTDFIDRKNQSLKDSQGVDDFSGSGYKGPGNVDHEKTNSNMGQRNF
jgi:hypothetical protein